MMPIGKSNEHLAFPGTLSLSYETLARLWYEICEGAHRGGVRKVLFFNSHGGQPQVMEIVCRELRVKLGMFAVSVDVVALHRPFGPVRRCRAPSRHPCWRGRDQCDDA